MARENPQRPRQPRRSRPMFALTDTALGLLRHLQPGGALRCKCDASPERSYLGPSVELLALDLRRIGSAERMPGVSMRLRCACCGARRTVRAVALPRAVGPQWSVFCALLGAMHETGVAARSDGAAASGQRGASEAPAASSPAPASPRPRSLDVQVVPSRHDPTAPPISDDELIDVVVAIRRATTWAAVLAAIGIGKAER